MQDIYFFYEFLIGYGMHFKIFVWTARDNA